MHEGTGKALEKGIEYKLGVLAEEVRGLTKWLQGNGRQGVIQEMRLDIDLLKQQKIEQKVKERLLKWALRIVGGLLLWAWGVICGPLLPRLEALLKVLGW